jgi:plastocyanin
MDRLILTASCFLSVLGLPIHASTTYITATNNNFSPSEKVVVHVGDTILFTCKTGTHSTVSADKPFGAAPWRASISPGNDFMYVPEVKGNYRYICSDHAAMGMSGKFRVDPRPMPHGFFDVSYNTVTNTLHVVCPTSSPPNFNLYIKDGNGKALMSIKVVKQEMDIDVSSLPKGVYGAMGDLNEWGVIVTRRFIKKK